ncbi:MAG: hypothetical protein HYZ53_22945 [Planctomycetes bacterium]|nr:hypothetical protein [Planctomycetota bacterium]
MTARKRKRSGESRGSAPSEVDTGEFDREFAADSFRVPDAEARRRWQSARLKPGRPREGRGVRVISVSVEKGLLASADRLAKKKRLTRARLIARGLRAVLAAEGEL